MNRKSARQKAEALVAQMTVAEAASQLRYDAPAVPRLGVPAYNWWNEALHGVARSGMATMFPQAIGIGAMFDPELTQKLGDVAATEGRAKYNAASAHGDRDIYKGLTYWSPNVNIFRDPRWGRGHETFGEDPYLTSEIGCAYVHGLQGDGETLKASACAKHFAVHSGPEALRHRFNAIASPKDMAETYLPAFKALVEKAKVESVMGAYNRTNGEPCCASNALMEHLRRDWGFEGHFVSDCWALKDFHEGHMVTSSPVESAAMALKAGCDVNCGLTYQALVVAYLEGMVTEEEIRTCAIRLFTTRYLLGIMGEKCEYDQIPYTAVECDEHQTLADEASRKACVLLKNDGMLPLDLTRIKTLGVIGPNADSRRALIGNYHGTSSRYITVQEGLQDALRGKARVLCSEGCHLFLDKVEDLSSQIDDRVAEAVTVAENSDAVVLVVGLDESLEGEEHDMGNPYGSDDKRDLLLPPSQRRLMDAVLAVGKPTTIVLMVGSAIDLGAAGEKANAVLLPWYPGAHGGEAVADILLGKVSPSGKLPVTFYRNEQLQELPDFTDYTMRGRTYRYVQSEPLYPFGYGLTYGDVVVTGAAVEEQGDSVLVIMTLHNGGSVDTQDVAQVYCQNEGSPNAPAHPRLCGFKRVFVPAGESVEAVVSVDREAFRVVNSEGEFVDEGSIVLFCGVGQPDTRTEALTGHSSVVLSL